MIDKDDPNYGDDCYPDTSLVSNCCGARPLGPIHQAGTELDMAITGICSACRDYCFFEQEAEEE